MAAQTEQAQDQRAFSRGVRFQRAGIEAQPARGCTRHSPHTNCAHAQTDVYQASSVAVEVPVQPSWVETVPVLGLVNDCGTKVETASYSCELPSSGCFLEPDGVLSPPCVADASDVDSDPVVIIQSKVSTPRDGTQAGGAEPLGREGISQVLRRFTNPLPVAKQNPQTPSLRVTAAVAGNSPAHVGGGTFAGPVFWTPSHRFRTTELPLPASLGLALAMSPGAGGYPQRSSVGSAWPEALAHPICTHRAVTVAQAVNAVQAGLQSRPPYPVDRPSAAQPGQRGPPAQPATPSQPAQPQTVVAHPAQPDSRLDAQWVAPTGLAIVAHCVQSPRLSGPQGCGIGCGSRSPVHGGVARRASAPSAIEPIQAGPLGSQDFGAALVTRAAVAAGAAVARLHSSLLPAPVRMQALVGGASPPARTVQVSVAMAVAASPPTTQSMQLALPSTPRSLGQGATLQMARPSSPRPGVVILKAGPMTPRTVCTVMNLPATPRLECGAASPRTSSQPSSSPGRRGEADPGHVPVPTLAPEPALAAARSVPCPAAKPTPPASPRVAVPTATPAATPTGLRVARAKKSSPPTPGESPTSLAREDDGEPSAPEERATPRRQVDVYTVPPLQELHHLRQCEVELRYTHLQHVEQHWKGSLRASSPPAAGAVPSGTAAPTLSSLVERRLGSQVGSCSSRTTPGNRQSADKRRHSQGRGAGRQRSASLAPMAQDLQHR